MSNFLQIRGIHNMETNKNGKKPKKKHFRQIKTGVVPGIQGKKKKKGT